LKKNVELRELRSEHNKINNLLLLFRIEKKEKKSTRFYLIPTHISQNLEDTILDLCRYQLAKQLLRIT